MTSTSGSSGARAAAAAQWPPEPVPPVGYLSRKALPIKRNDAEPLTRDDVQYDLLTYIFTNDKAVFTNPYGSGEEKLTFNDLYVSALYHSSKCSKVLKEKMNETPAFAAELAKISLLTNVGRINTTMAFFPEMKTALRTYHPVPSLQKTDGNAQDAPRIKNCLKAALLPSETKGVPPSTPEEVVAKRQEGKCPPTSVVNLIFVLSNHAAPLAPTHFDGTFNFLDLFLPGKSLASLERAQVFLWLAYHYLETSDGPNPFDDAFSKKHPGKAPMLRRLTEEEQEKENVDTPEEIQWGRTMSAKRNNFLQQLVASFAVENRTGRSTAPLFISVTPETGTGRRSQRHVYDAPRDETSFLYYVPTQPQGPPAEMSPPGPSGASDTREPGPEPQSNERTRTSPTTTPTLTAVRQDQIPQAQLAPRLLQRSMLEHAWIIATTTDPLDDSDGEADSQHVLLDYSRRLKVLKRLEDPPPSPEDMGNYRITRQFMP